jgi:hypothetical protein
VRLAALAVLAAALIAPAAADASSLVLLRPDGNVWLANPDGSGLYQVTLDGTPDDPYGAPSQADDGTIVTTRGPSGGDELIHRLAQNGTVLSSFKPAVEFSLGLFDAEISPDGSKIAYWTGFFGNGNCDTGSTGTTACYITEVTASTGPTVVGGGLVSRSSPSWMSATRILTGGTDMRLSTYDLGSGGDVSWTGITDHYTDPELSRDGKRIAHTDTAALTGQELLDVRQTTGDPRVDGPPPGALADGCQFNGAAGGSFVDPTWSPDANVLAWEEGDLNTSNAPGPNEGIWTLDMTGVPDLAAMGACATLPQSRLVIPGGSKPDWGPANVNPGPRGPGGGNGGGGGGGGDTTKPAFQGAVALSNSTFAAAQRGGSVAARAKVGTTVRYRLSEAATVTFTVERQSAGRRSGRGCVKPNRTNRRARRCTRYVKVRGSFTHAGRAGANSFKFTGRLRGRKLSPARYRLVAVARDAAGNVSAARRSNFRIVRR